MMQLYWVALKSIWTKEIHRFMRIWVQTLVPPVITMTLYFVIFGNLIGSRIGEMHAGAAGDHHDALLHHFRQPDWLPHW